MSASSDLLSAPKEFLQLFKEGKEAAQRGDNARAHDLFRQAIEVDPYHELVWLWLASVVDTDEDRRVCFENVLELNPTNPTAHRQLEQLEEKALDQIMHPQPYKRIDPARRRRRVRLVLVLLILIAGAVAALLFLV